MQAVGQLGDGERSGTKQAFDFAYGKIGYPVGGNLPGGLPDHFCQVSGGDAKLPGIESRIPVSVEVRMQQSEKAIGQFLVVGGGYPDLPVGINRTDFGDKDKKQAAQYFPVRTVRSVGIMAVDCPVIFQKKALFFHIEQQIGHLFHFPGDRGLEHIRKIVHKFKRNRQQKATKIIRAGGTMQYVSGKQGEQHSRE